MITAGLTGGIATGKSTAAKFFKDTGALIIDADAISRAAVNRNQPAWKGIVEHFGRQILLKDKQINREALGDIIFNNPEHKTVLNRIVHPHVIKEIDTQLQQIAAKTPKAVVIIDVPLLFETGLHKHFKPVIVVYIPADLQLKRLMARDNSTAANALARIGSQTDIETKKNLADIVIDNSGSRTKTRQTVINNYKLIIRK